MVQIGTTAFCATHATMTSCGTLQVFLKGECTVMMPLTTELVRASVPHGR